MREQFLNTTPDPVLRQPVRDSTRILILVASAAMVASCGQSPVSPASHPLMVSGHVYQLGSVDLGEPTLSGVLITIQQPDGLRQTALTDGTGFYTVSATFGPVLIMAMKPGFRVRHSRFNLADDTVLNFSLTPTPQDAGTAARLELH